MIKFKLLIEFLIYSFIGWIWEVAITSVYLGQFADRGLLDIPLCPIYGVGAFIIIFINYNIKNINILYKFIIFAISLTSLEYISHIFIRLILNIELWTYEHWPLNFQGKISLFSSLGFGIASLLLIKTRFYLFNKKQ